MRWWMCCCCMCGFRYHKTNDLIGHEPRINETIFTSTSVPVVTIIRSEWIWKQISVISFLNNLIRVCVCAYVVLPDLIEMHSFSNVLNFVCVRVFAKLSGVVWFKFSTILSGSSSAHFHNIHYFSYQTQWIDCNGKFIEMKITISPRGMPECEGIH